MNELFDVFRGDPLNIPKGREAVAALIALPDSEPVAARALDFLETEPQDEVRTWAISVLRGRPDPGTFDTLLELVRSMVDPQERRKSKLARLYALATLHELADTPQREAVLDELLAERWTDTKEDALPRALAAALGALRGQRDATDTLDGIFDTARGSLGSYWLMWAVLRALRESPPAPADGPLARVVCYQLMALIRGSEYVDHRHSAIELLGRFPPRPEVVRGLGEVLVDDKNEDLRLRAAVTLKALAQDSASRDLVQAVGDANAEVRVQAVAALKCSVGEDRAIRALVEAAMERGVDVDRISCLVDALRMLDRERSRSTELLSKEMAGEDRERAQCAERMLLDLGGWSAVHRLGQRRATLKQLDAMLEDSERAVQRTFERTIDQARVNFRFALGVNILVVLIGVVLVGVAVAHLISTPEDFETWVLPGGAGVVGILLAQFFNNPRQNARDDLATLVNVNVLFLGFLRQLNQIDATFKHGYIENREFGSADMQATVAGIQSAVDRTLEKAAQHLRFATATANPNATLPARGSRNTAGAERWRARRTARRNRGACIGAERAVLTRPVYAVVSALTWAIWRRLAASRSWTAPWRTCATRSSR